MLRHVQRLRLTVSTRDKDDIPFAKTVPAVGEGKMDPVFIPDGTPAFPLQHAVTNQDGSEPTCSTEGATYFEQRIDKVYPDLLGANHCTCNNRGILAPTDVDIDHINDFILDKNPGRGHHHLPAEYKQSHKRCRKHVRRRFGRALKQCTRAWYSFS